MSEGATGAKPRRGLRWTLGGLMLLIALVALPMAWYAHQARENARIRMEADVRRAKVIAQINSQVKHIELLWIEKAAIGGKIQRSRAEPAEPPR
jgi:hypothetical protein